MTDYKIRVVKREDPLFPKTLEFREEILMKPLGISLFRPAGPSYKLDNEEDQTTIACVEGDQIIGCIMLQSFRKGEIGELCRLRQIAVSPHHQGKHVGRSLMKFAEEYAFTQNYRRIFIHAILDSVGFYYKLGYSDVGEEFEEWGICHVRVEKDL